MWLVGYIIEADMGLCEGIWIGKNGLHKVYWEKYYVKFSQYYQWLAFSVNHIILEADVIVIKKINQHQLLIYSRNLQNKIKHHW